MTALPPVFVERPIAHRALHNRAAGRVENSLAAVRAAIARGFPVELDLQMSLDGEAMVFHDYTLDRLTDARGAISDRTASELEEIPLTGGSDQIPRLSAILAEVRGEVPLLLEMKDQDGRLGPNVGKLEAAIADALNGYEGPVATMSYNPHSVAEMARLLPNVPRGLVTGPFSKSEWPRVPDARRKSLGEIADYQRVGASFISHSVADLEDSPVARLKREGAVVLCWTVRSREVEARARRIADNITFEGYEPGA